MVLMIAAALVPGFRVRGLGPALVGSLVLGIMNWGATVLLG